LFSHFETAKFRPREQATKVHVHWAWTVRAFLWTRLLGGAWNAEKLQSSSAYFDL